MSHNGWVKAYRGLDEHAWLGDDLVARAVWIGILQAADYREPNVGRVNLTALRDRGRLSRQAWRTTLARFVAEGMLALEPRRALGRGRGSEQFAVVTKYRAYQNHPGPSIEVPDVASGAAVLRAPTGPTNHPTPPATLQTTLQTTLYSDPRTASPTRERGSVRDEVAVQATLQSTRSSRSKNVDLEEGRETRAREQSGATPAPPEPSAGASLSQELDIDHDPPPAPPLAPDDIGMDPRLVGSEALMDRLTGKGSGLRDEQAARAFFTRLLGAANAKHLQVEPRRLDWYRQHGEAYIESVWREAITNQDPRNARPSPLFYFVDALNGRFLPRAHAERAAARAAAREPDPTLEPGTLVMLPNGETRILDDVSGVWAYLDGAPNAVRASELRPVQEVRP